MSVLIVTGTSTGVGKTVVTAALAALAPGPVAVVKPAQTGVGPDEPGDLAEVARLCGVTSLHEFARYPEPLSPHHAARCSGLPELALHDTAERIAELTATHESVLVEGAGGLLVPYDRSGWTLLDLAHALNAPVLVVTTAGLGTLNHTALTMRVLDAESVDVAGIVIGSWPAAPGLAERCNLTDLAAMTDHGVLAGVVPAGVARRSGFRSAAEASLAPPFGGTFDWPAFVAETTEEAR